VNRTYRLVWNVALRVVQVASELTSSRAGGSQKVAEGASPRQRALVSALAAAGLLLTTSSAFAATCDDTTLSACSAQGGVPSVVLGSDRLGQGGAGNGGGGNAVTAVYAQVPGAQSTSGTGGAGTNGVDFAANPADGPGGQGGAVGSLQNLGVSATGQNGADAGPASRFGGGGGGGGAGGYYNGAATQLDAVTLIGGAGGSGGNVNANVSSAGGGGGGGAGLILENTGNLSTVATITGGAGGQGGTNTVTGGGGGGGGDGLVVIGGPALSNAGTITGGVGGAAGGGGAGPHDDGNSGAGVNMFTSGMTFTNTSTGVVVGGAATGSGLAGPGVISRGDTVNTSGTLSGGADSGGFGSAVLAIGGGNILNVSGAIIHGALEVASGGQATVAATAVASSLDGIQLDGGGAAVQLSGSLALDVGAPITGTGDVTSSGAAPITLRGVDIDGSLDMATTAGTRTTGTIQTTGAQTYRSSVTLLGDTSILSASSAVDFGGTLDGAHSLQVTTPGAVVLSGNVGGTTPLTLLTVESAMVSAGNINAGTLSLVAQSGTIGQSGIFNVSGNAFFDAGAQDVLLPEANNFGGSVVVFGSTIYIHSASDLNLVSVADTGTGSLTFSSDGTLSLPGPLDTTGTVSLASNGGSLTTVGQIGGSAVTLAGDTGITLNSPLAATGVLTLTADHGGIVQTVGSILAATLTASASGDILLGSAANTIGSLGDITSGTLTLTDASLLTIAGTVTTGSASLKDAHGIVLVGALHATNSIALGAGTSLTVGNGGMVGSLSGNVSLAGGTLTFNRADNVAYVGVISGTGQTVKQGAGTLYLDAGASAFTGTNQVQAGTLIVGSTAGSNALLGGDVTVAANAGLGGHGQILGNVSMASGSTLSPGNSVGTLTVDGDLTMAAGSTIDAELGAAGAGDKVVVGGNLNLGGVTVNVADAGGLGAGVYNLFSYGGTYTDNGGLALGTVPPSQALALQVLTGSKQINLLNALGVTLNFWNANGLASASQLGGGAGIWSVTSPVWTDASGSYTSAMTPQPGFAVFGGAPGVVTIDGTAGQVSATGIQFLSDGYHLTGDSVLLAGGGSTPVIRVGDGSAASAGYVATIDNVLTGTDGLAKNDAGTLVLGGANTYSGQTIVNGGTLSVGDERNLGAIANGVTLNGGALRVTGTSYNATDRALTLATGGAVDVADASNTFAWNGAIAGSGSLEKRGAGVLVLDHANAYTGGTSVTQGTLRLGDSGAIGSGDLSLASGTTLDLGANALALTNAVNVAGTSTINVDTSGTATLSGVIADGATSGGFTKTGAGELLVTGNNTYTGTTTIADGVLHVGNGGTQGAVGGDIVDHGVLLLDRSDDVTYAGALSGEGAFRKLGGGLLHLTGDSSGFTGATDFTAGTLQLDGKLGGDLTMASGSVLTGTGTAGNVALLSGAEVSPGGQGVPATLAFAGNLSMASGTRYTVDVTDAGQSDRLDVAGHATLDGGTVVSVGSGGQWAASTTYTILSAAGGVSGTFGSASTDLAFLTPSLAYTPSAVNLTLARNGVSFPDVAVTRNERATAGAVEALGAGASTYDAVLRLDAPDARAAFDSLSGEINASTRTAIADDQRYQREAINNHLLNAAAVDGGEGVAAWTAVWGHWGDHDGDGNAARTSASGGGVLVGADTAVGQSTRVGLAIGSGQISASTPERDASADVRTRTAGIYAGGRVDAFQWQAGALYGQEKIRTHRTVTVGDAAGRVGSDEDAHATQGYVEGAYVIDGARGSWAPFVNVAFQQLRTPTIHEHGELGALDVASDRSSQTFGTLGLRGEAKLGDAGTSLFGSVGWRHAWGDVDSSSRMRFADGGASFDVQGVPIADDAGVVTAGVRFRPSQSVTVDATYSGQFAKDAKDQSARLSLSWAF
jgi:fibronectin-binding autotransporter adhesin